MDCSRFSLEGKVALITGGSRGIGKACALAFADAGAIVVVSSRKQADLDAVVEEIQAKNGKARAIASHVAKLEEQKKLVDQVVKEFGRIDILFNNAGTNPYPGSLLDAEEWAWDTTMNVNLKGQFFLSQLVARVMKEKGGGTIINTASVAGLRASGLSIYGVTKAGLIMLTQCMAREWGQYGIRVNAIAPGVIETRLAEALWKDPAVRAAAVNRMPVGFLGQPDDVAGAVLFLASEASRYVSGVTMVIDGGSMVGTATSPE